MKVSKKKRLKAAHCPSHLSGRAREHWLELVGQAPAGALLVSDAALLGVLACALAAHEQAAVKTIEFGALVMTGTKAEVNPWLTVQNQQAAIIARVGRELGLRYWREGAPTRGYVGKKQAAAAAAQEVGGRFAMPAGPKLVVNN